MKNTDREGEGGRNDGKKEAWRSSKKRRGRKSGWRNERKKVRRKGGGMRGGDY